MRQRPKAGHIKQLCCWIERSTTPIGAAALAWGDDETFGGGGCIQRAGVVAVGTVGIN